MSALNAKIEETDGLGKNYQIGAAYFLKLRELDNSFERLWSDYLEPLLSEYVTGMPEETEYMNAFKAAYDSADKNNDAAPEN
jgi:5-methylcytosine-specific restriction protein B